MEPYAWGRKALKTCLRPHSARDQRRCECDRRLSPRGRVSICILMRPELMRAKHITASGASDFHGAVISRKAEDRVGEVVSAILHRWRRRTGQPKTGSASTVARSKVNVGNMPPFEIMGAPPQHAHADINARMSLTQEAMRPAVGSRAAGRRLEQPRHAIAQCRRRHVPAV